MRSWLAVWSLVDPAMINMVLPEVEMGGPHKSSGMRIRCPCYLGATIFTKPCPTGLRSWAEGYPLLAPVVVQIRATATSEQHQRNHPDPHLASRRLMG